MNPTTQKQRDNFTLPHHKTGAFNSRKYSVDTQNQTQSNGAYFKREEHYETINENDKFNPSEIQETRVKNYTTGATYDGQWRGGFRDGEGTMTWADGAKYQGEWK